VTLHKHCYESSKTSNYADFGCTEIIINACFGRLKLCAQSRMVSRNDRWITVKTASVTMQSPRQDAVVCKPLGIMFVGLIPSWARMITFQSRFIRSPRALKGTDRRCNKLFKVVSGCRIQVCCDDALCGARLRQNFLERF
jgi:hypothetical protein